MKNIVWGVVGIALLGADGFEQGSDAEVAYAAKDAFA